MSESTRLERLVMACAAGAMAAESTTGWIFGSNHDVFAEVVLNRAKALEAALAKEEVGAFPTVPTDATDEEIASAATPRRTEERRVPPLSRCCDDCYNSHGECVDHGNCPCHRKGTDR